MLRLIKQSLFPAACSALPLEIWHRLANVDLLLPYYHVVSDEEVPHVSALYTFRSVRQFEADIDAFCRVYKPVTLDHLVRFLNGSATLPRRAFFLSFDDGFREIHDVIAPILRRHGVPATFFLIPPVLDNRELCHPQKKSLLLRALAASSNETVHKEVDRRLSAANIRGTDRVSRLRGAGYSHRTLLDELALVLDCDFKEYLASSRPYLTTEQVHALLRQGFSIGAHSMGHPLYSELSVQEQLEQTTESARSLAERFQRPCNAFAFPYRDNGVGPEFFERVFDASGVDVCFGTAGTTSHFHPRNLERFTMERTDAPARQVITRQLARKVSRCDFTRPHRPANSQRLARQHTVPLSV